MRRRRHRNELFNAIAMELEPVKERVSGAVEDLSLWRCNAGFKSEFSSQETWLLTRSTYAQTDWAKSVWFSQATPKYAFISWLAMLDRLATMDRIVRWSSGVDDTCVLCKSALESRSHLFFECSYSSQLWEHLVLGVVGNLYTTVWTSILDLLKRPERDKRKLFCLRYAFQVAIYVIWRERNKIKHGEKPLPVIVVKKLVDKEVRNKLSLMKSKGCKGMELALQYWFSTRV